MAETQSLLSPDEPTPLPKVHRDDLMISLPMAYIIMASGFIASLLEPIFAGISFFFVLVQYAILPKYFFLSYYSYLGTSLSFGYCYVFIFSAVINTSYTMWAWITIPKRYAQVMYTCSLVLAIITLILSLAMMRLDQMFGVMAHRNRDWFLTASTASLADWDNRVFASYRVTDIFRCVFLLIQAIQFGFAYHFSQNDLAAAMYVAGF
jgi:hypothetical protein